MQTHLTHRHQLEIAVGTPDEAALAEAGGADRLELSSGLELGGLTPSLGLFRAVRDSTTLPVWVLLRPRPGDFTYSPREFDAIRADAELFLSDGAAGIVFGILNSAGGIEREGCCPLVDLAQGRAVFHRAFDFLRDPFQSLDELIDLGFRRVLTSGGAGASHADLAKLAALVKHAAERIEILPAGGIRPSNVVDLVRASGCDQIHSSARGAAPTARSELEAVMGASTGTSEDIVRALRLQLDSLS